jgi:hypothetical protein
MATSNTATTTLRPSKAPNLPIAPVEYSQQYQDQLNNVLRLYFNQIDNFGLALVGLPAGPIYSFRLLPHQIVHRNTPQQPIPQQ